MNWIVKNEPKQATPVAYEVRIANALNAAGIDPKNWTDAELANWRDCGESWEIRQAMRMEKTRRENEGKTATETWAGKADTMWTR